MSSKYYLLLPIKAHIKDTITTKQMFHTPSIFHTIIFSWETFLLCDILTNQGTELSLRWCQVSAATTQQYRADSTRFWSHKLVLYKLSIFSHYIMQYLSSIICLFCIDIFDNIKSTLIFLLHQPNIKTYFKRIDGESFRREFQKIQQQWFIKQFLFFIN